MNITLTREDHIKKLNELLKENATDTYVAKGKKGDHYQELALLRQEKEMLEHEVEKLTWFNNKEEQATPVVSSNIDRGDDTGGDNKEPVLV